MLLWFIRFGLETGLSVIPKIFYSNSTFKVVKWKSARFANSAARNEVPCILFVYTKNQSRLRMASVGRT